MSSELLAEHQQLLRCTTRRGLNDVVGQVLLPGTRIGSAKEINEGP
jgi:hypothetical protein